MDLATTYMGLKLAHPFMAGASPLAHDLAMVKRLEDAGASAIVMHSLFEEQIRREQMQAFLDRGFSGESRLDALTFTPRPASFHLGPEEYLAHLARIKALVSVPVIGSLNGITLGGWLDYARGMEQAGADGIELNVYAVPAELELTGQAIEDRTIEMVRTVRAHVRIPLAVKISPFYTAPANFMRRLSEAGADALVLFNRFYQPDLDPHTQDSDSHPQLSNSTELPLRLHWIALMAGRVRASLAASGGVTDALDAVKALMCGAHAVQMVSALLRRGPEHLAQVRRETMDWMREHGYESLEELRGCMSLEACPDPSGYERAHYMLMLQHWSPSS